MLKTYKKKGWLSKGALEQNFVDFMYSIIRTVQLTMDTTFFIGS